MSAGLLIYKFQADQKWPARVSRQTVGGMCAIDLRFCVVNSITIRLYSEHQSIPADKTHSGVTKRWRHRTVEAW